MSSAIEPTASERAETGRFPRVQVVNRGIAVAAVYAIVLLGTAVGLHRGDVLPTLAQPQIFVVFGLVGYLVGAICGYSNTDRDSEGTRRLDLNILDAAVASLWAAIAVFAADLALAPFESAAFAIQLVGILAGGSILGGLVGEPILSLLGKIRVKGRHPFHFIRDATERIRNPDARFVWRVVLQTVMFAFLATLAAIAIAIVIAVIVVMLAIWFFVASTSESSGRKTVYVPRGGRVRDDGRIVDRRGQRTSQRIDEDGHILEQSFLGEERLGMRIDRDGRVLNEGLLGDSRTGVRLKQDGSKQRIVKEGVFSDHDTGLGLDAQGRAYKERTLGKSEAGIAITSEGGVHETED